MKVIRALSSQYNLNEELLNLSKNAFAVANKYVGAAGWRQFKGSKELDASLREVVQPLMDNLKTFPADAIDTQIGVFRAPLHPEPARGSVNPKQMAEMATMPPYNTNQYLTNFSRLKTNLEKEIRTVLPGWMVLWGHQAHTDTYTHTQTHTHMQTHMHTHTRIHTYTHTYIHTYTHTHTHTHTQ